MRAKFGFADNDIIFVYCSRLSPEKGCLELIMATKLVANAKLLIIGGENFSSNKETQYTIKLKSAADSIKQRVHFTGYISHDEIPQYLSIGDVGVVPSVCNEAASSTMLEMHAASLPVIASNRGGIPEYCEPSNTVLVDTDQFFVRNLAKSMEQFISNPQMYNMMKEHCMDGIDYYDYDSYYQRFIKLIRDNTKPNTSVKQTTK